MSVFFRPAAGAGLECRSATSGRGDIGRGVKAESFEGIHLILLPPMYTF